MTVKKLIFKEIENNRDDYINFLKDLIEIKSYNPPGNELDVALKIKDYLNEENIKFELYPFGNNRANLIAYLNENFNGKNLIFNGHMDVVPPGSDKDWKNPPLFAFIKDNKVMYGRGTSDMKGGLAAMIIALKVLKKLNVKLSGNLILNAVAEEETGGALGTKWCIENKLGSINCDFVIVGEPSGFNQLSKSIFLGEKGSLQIKIITHGVSCHASTPFLGKNAIYIMNTIIQNLSNLNDFMPEINLPISKQKLMDLISQSFQNNNDFKTVSNREHFKNLLKCLTELTLSVTKIKGGFKENIVPDKCEAIIDIRFFPEHTNEMILNALRALLFSLGYPTYENSVKEPNDLFVSLEVINHTEASYYNTWEKSVVLSNFYNIVEDVYKSKPFFSIFPAGSDAEFYRNQNYCHNTIIFGPGNYENAHSLNEYIEIQDYMNAIKVYTLFAYDFLK